MRADGKAAAEVLQSPQDKNVEAFARSRGIYERFAEYIHDLVGEHCGSELIHTTEYRAKTVDSFGKKCEKLNDDGSRKYKIPLQEITDLAGVRVIVFVRESVDLVIDRIRGVFDVIESEDVGERVYSQGKFGYQSKHLLVKLGDDRKSLVENKSFRDLKCEIQVRTILQHAWAEMEHDIQYKTDKVIPLDLRKRFSALAGLLEIADREFQAIQRESEYLTRVVQNELVDQLTQEGLSEAEDEVEQTRTVSARDLVASGKYNEAIDIYTKKIEREPNSMTLYIGRSKSRFLTGDVQGAIHDLDEVDRLAGGVSSVGARLRAIFQRGDDPAALGALAANFNFGLELNNANEALSAGDGVKAFELYTTLEQRGYNKAFSLFGKAMSCALEKDITGAWKALEQLEIRPATPMAVSICALRSVLTVLEEADAVQAEEALRQVLADIPNYRFEVSPLKPFAEGLNKKKQISQLPKINKIFATIGADLPKTAVGAKKIQ